MQMKPVALFAALILLAPAGLAQTDSSGTSGSSAGGAQSGGSQAVAPALDMAGEAIEGWTVETDDGTEVGTVEDTANAADGMQQIVITTAEGFLDGGSRTIAVDAAKAGYDRENRIVMLSMTKDELEQLAEHQAR